MDWGPRALFPVLISMSHRNYSIQGRWGGGREREGDKTGPKDKDKIC